MQLKDIKKGFIPSREQILKAVTTGVVIVLCALAGFSVQLILKRGTTEQIVLAAVADPAAIVPEPSETEITEASVPETEATTETAAVSETSETSETSTSESETSESEETTKATTSATTTAATTAAVTESDLQLAVYATTVLNVRSGPGTDYSLVKQVNPGDQIDVVAVTSNGWYKTYNGNYVKADPYAEACSYGNTGAETDHTHTDCSCDRYFIGRILQDNLLRPAGQRRRLLQPYDRYRRDLHRRRDRCCGLVSISRRHGNLH